MSRWFDQRLRAFNAQVAINGTTMVCNGVSVECLAPPSSDSTQMEGAGRWLDGGESFQLLRANAIRAKVQLKAEFIFNGQRYQVHAYEDDPVDAHVTVRAKVIVPTPNNRR